MKFLNFNVTSPYGSQPTDLVMNSEIGITTIIIFTFSRQDIVTLL